MTENPGSSRDESRSQGTSGRRAAWFWVVCSLACSLGSIVAHGFALSLAGRAAMATAKREEIPPETLPLMSGLFQTATVLAFGGLLFGIPAVRRGNAVSRVAVLVAFLAAVVWMFVMV